MATRLEYSQLRANCSVESVGFESTEQIAQLEGIVGQDRGLKALQFGLGMQLKGFNIYVAGEEGTGRTAAVKEFLSQIASGKSAPSDWCYVHNFKDSYVPTALELAPGRGLEFAKDMAELVETARNEIPKAFETEDYARQRESTLRTYNQRREQRAHAMEEAARARGFTMQASPVGLVVVPLVEGRPMTEQEFAQLPPDERQSITRERSELDSEISDMLRDIRAIEREAAEALEKLDRQTALFVIGHVFDSVRSKYEGSADVMRFLDDAREDMLENLAQMRGQTTRTQESSAQRSLVSGARDVQLRKYAVNVLVDNKNQSGAPVVMEQNPTYANLFGRIEKEAQMGVLITDLTLVRAGALHRANGGYLVVPAEELLRNPLAYEGLKRALRSSEIAVEEPGERLGLMVTKTLRPAPVPLSIKVIMIGSSLLYERLAALDPEFNEFFKVKAEFDTSMERNAENTKTYAALLCKVCSDENLKHLDSSAIAYVVEYGSRLASDQSKLSTRFADIADVIREADYYASQQGSAYVSKSHVQEALAAKLYRSDLMESKFKEFVHRGIMKIETRGRAVGEINALSITGFGSTLVFGRPSRITASVGAGRGGIIDIERSVNLGGPLHSKGVLILSGYITQKYSRDIPLSLTARLVFEQSYSMVDGDSASAAELYALLSAISGIPLKRSLAITGSVNQSGEIQAIGGVNEKVEGFYEVCKLAGLTGEQGVIIPESNVQNLMLKEEVVEACKEGKFHVYSIRTIDEGLALLTGLEAGEPDSEGKYPPESANSQIHEQLQDLAKKTLEYDPLHLSR